MSTKPFIRKNKEYESNLNEARLDKYMTVKELCNLAGIEAGEFYSFCNGSCSPLYLKKGEVKPQVQRILDVLNVSFEDAFPRYSCKLHSGGADGFVPSQLFDFYGEYSKNTPEKILSHQALKSAIKQLFSSLGGREKVVLILRFGLFGEDEHTLDALADVLGVTRERVRQVEEKALKKLFRSSRNCPLKPPSEMAG